MTAAEKIARIHLKIERAKKHINDLYAAEEAFHGPKPHELSVKHHLDTGKKEIYISHLAKIPDEIGIIAGDAFHNLRSALDHLARQLSLMLPGANPDNEFNFPFFNRANQFETFLKGIKKTLRKDAIDVLAAVQPYKGGRGHQLWVLNRLDNIDKHRIIITVGTANVGIKFGPKKTAEIARMFASIGETYVGALRRESPITGLKVGNVLHTFLPNEEFDKDMQFHFKIALDEPGIIECKPLIETLQHFSDLVSGTVTMFKPCLS